MSESTATIKLRAVDQNVVTTINNVSTAATNATIATTAFAGGFKLLEKASNTGVAKMAVGANQAELLANSFNALSSSSNKVTKALGGLGNAVFYVQQFAIAADGVGKAAEQMARLPQAMRAMQASGVSTYPIQQFNELTQAIRGSDIALDSLVTSAIAELGQFEAAAARAGTILKSSLRFDDAGNALTANAQERLQNAISAQNLVNNELGNAVTSTQALIGQYEVLSSGFTDSAKSQEVLKQALKLVSIGQTGGVAVNTTKTVQLLTKTMNAYSQEAEEAGRTAAILNAIVENGLTTIPELAQGLGRTASQAAKANIALVDTGAAVSVLTAQGTSTAEALSGIARLAANIISKTPEAEKELAKLQLRGEKIRFDKAEIQAKGFTQALVDLYDAIGGSPEILSKILPEDVAFRTANALLVEQGKRLQNTRNAIAGADEDSLNKIFDISQSARINRYERLANRFKESIIEIGLILAPTLEGGIKALETIANKFAGLPEPVRKAIGSYLAFKIQANAAKAAIGELVKTLIGLATNYLLVRTLSLALTGQLGKEISAVKNLITQKKGLIAATMQLFGVDQKWRLEQESITQAINKQSKVAKVAAAAKKKASSVVSEVFTSVVAKTSGITKEQAEQELIKRKDQAIAFGRGLFAKAKDLAREVVAKYDIPLPGMVKGAVYGDSRPPIPLLPPAREYPALPAIGQTSGGSVVLPSSGQVIVPATSQQSLPFYPLAAPPVIPQAPPRPQKPVLALPAAGQSSGVYIPPTIPIDRRATPQLPFPARPMSFKTFPEEPGKVPVSTIPLLPPAGGTSGVYTPPVTVSPATQPLDRKTTEKLDKIVARDRKLIAAQSEYAKSLGEVDAAEKQLRNTQIRREKAIANIEKREKALIKAREKAITTTKNIQGALNKVAVEEEKLKKAKNVLVQREIALTEANNALIAKSNILTESQITLEAAKTAAKTKYEKIAKAIVIAETAEAKAAALTQKASVAKVTADQAEAVVGKQNLVAMRLKRDAYYAEIKAKNAVTLASQKRAIVQRLETQLTYEQMLAENGMYESKFFGSTLILRQEGLIGKVNKILTTNISLTKIATVAELAYAKAKIAVAAATNIQNIKQAFRAFESAVMGAGRGIKGIFNLIKSGGVGAKSALGGIMSPLGAMSPLLLATAGAAVVLRSELFGIGKETRKATKAYKEFLKEQEKLNISIQKRTGLTVVEGLLNEEDYRVRQSITLVPEASIDESGLNSIVTATENAAKTIAKTPITVPVGLVRGIGSGISSLIFPQEKAKNLDQEIAKGVLGGDEQRAAIANQLTILKDSGALTTNEFNRLAKAFEGTAEGGRKATESLAELRREIKRIKGGAEEVEKGIFGKIGDVIKSIPGGAGKAIDFSVNRLIANSGLFGIRDLMRGKVTTAEEIAFGRESGSLIETSSILRNQQARVAERYTETNYAIAEYRENLALTSEIQAKVAKGQKITSSDLALEEEAYQTRIDKNRAEIDQLGERIKSTKETASKAKNEETKKILDEQVLQAEREKKVLEERGELLKQLKEDTTKYLKDSLPAITTGIKESANPVLALSNAQDKFNQAFLLDGEGKATKFLKPLAQMRDEGAKVVSQIQENLSLGLLDENQAIAKIEAIRDAQVSVMEDGELVTGYKFLIPQRRALTEQIITLDRKATEQSLANNKLEISAAKILQQAKIETSVNTEVRINELQQEAIAERLALKEREIDRLKEQGLKTVQAELELEQLRQQELSSKFVLNQSRLKKDLEEFLVGNKIQINAAKILQQAQLETSANTNLEINELQQKAIAKRIANKQQEIRRLKSEGFKAVQAELELEQLRQQKLSSAFAGDRARLEKSLDLPRLQLQRSQLQGRFELGDSQRLSAIYSQQNTLISNELKQKQLRFRLESQYGSLTSRISKNQVFNAQTQVELAQLKQAKLESTIDLERSQLENQIAITKEQNLQRYIQAELNKQKAQLALLEARERYNLADINNASLDQLDRLSLQIEQAELNLENADRALDKAQFQLDTEEDIAQQKRYQLESSKELEQSSNAIAISQAILAETQAKITHEYNQQSEALNNRSRELSIQSKEASSILNFRNNELSLAGKLANSERDKQQIAKATAALKLRSLSSQLKSEAEILSINQQKQRLQLEAKQEETGADLTQNLADLTKIQANITKLKATGASPEAIAAEQQQYQAALAQRQALIARSISQSEEERLLRASQSVDVRAFQRESQGKIDRARVAAIETLPKGQRERLARGLFQEFSNRAGLSATVPNISGLVNSLSNYKIEVPNINVPKIELPSLEDIAGDVKSIMQEFKTNANSNSNSLNARPGEGKEYIINTLNLESPINITIEGAQDKEEIADELELRIFGQVGDIVGNLKNSVKSQF